MEAERSAQQAPPMPAASGRLFIAWLGASTIALATLHGFAWTMQAGWSFSQFGAVHMVPLVTALSIVRELAARTAATATALSVVAWAHSMGPTNAPRLRLTVAIWATAGTLVATLLATVTSVVASHVLAMRVFDVSRSDCIRGLGMLERDDFWAALRGMVLQAGIVGLLTWSVIVRLARWTWSLRSKIFTVWGGLWALGITTLLVKKC